MEPQSKSNVTTSRGKWQWKSNTDPWSKTEEPQWEFYSPEHNYLIEKADDEGKPEVDIGKYIVSIKHMLQNKKGNMTSQRPIRRIECKDYEVEVRSERYFETELPKSINKVFGNLKHFITFFSQRNPEILEFTERFEKFELTQSLNGFNKYLCHELTCCLAKELLEPIDEQLKDDSISAFQKKIKQQIRRRHEELILLFSKDFASFEEFYGAILKSYTMNTDLYLNLNKNLRNENWIAIDNLLPYVFCLCKAFFSLNHSPKEKIFQTIKSSITLYRGTALDELALSHYQIENGPKLFSWNSITSTSKSRRIAEKFMYENADIKSRKYPVLFIIEISLGKKSLGSEYLKWINIHQYSAIPDEHEVILAPGSTFEVEEILTDSNKRTIIRIKLRHEIESLAHEGLIMQGVLQTEMMSDKGINIVCLQGEELSEALKSISGNRIIEEIEFCLCTFDGKSLGELMHILPTLEKATELKFVSCKFENEQGIESLKLKEAKTCKILKVEIYDVQNFCQILHIREFWTCLRTVEVDFRNIEFLPSDFEWLNKFIQLTSLTLDFSWCQQMTDTGVNNLISQGLKYLTQLTSLALDFSGCPQITDEGVNNLITKRLKPLTKLSSLTLNFTGCGVTPEKMKNLKFLILEERFDLTSFFLNERVTTKFKTMPLLKFTRRKAENKPAYEEKEGTLVLKNCNENMSAPCFKDLDELIERAAAKGLKHRNQINCLTLDFSRCKQITDEGVSHVASQRLRLLTKITSLTLDFSECKRLTDRGVDNLASQGLRFLTQLTDLSLDFSECEQISDGGLNNLIYYVIKSLTQLTFLRLRLFGCRVSNFINVSLAKALRYCGFNQEDQDHEKSGTEILRKQPVIPHDNEEALPNSLNLDKQYFGGEGFYPTSHPLLQRREPEYDYDGTQVHFYPTQESLLPRGLKYNLADDYSEPLNFVDKRYSDNERREILLSSREERNNNSGEPLNFEILYDSAHEFLDREGLLLCMPKPNVSFIPRLKPMVSQTSLFQEPEPLSPLKIDMPKFLVRRASSQDAMRFKFRDF